MGERRRRDDRKDKRRRRRRSTSSSDGSSNGPKSKKTKVSMWDLGPIGGPTPPRLSAGATPPPGAPLMIGGLPTASLATPGADPNAKKLYVANIPPQLTDQMVTNFFKMHATAIRRRAYQKKIKTAEDDMLDTVTIPKPNDLVNPIVNVEITRSEDPEKPGSAYVDLNDEDLTTDCLALDGKACPLPDGTTANIRVGRPNNYAPPVARPAPAPRAGVTLPAEAEGKYVMSGFPANMSLDTIRDLLETFGELEKYQVFNEETGASHTCCVFEFADEETNGKAMNALNGINFCSHVLSVKRVGSGALVMTKELDMAAREQAEKSLLQNLTNLGVGLSHALRSLADCVPRTARLPNTLAARMNAISVKKPTKILALINLFDEEDLEDQETYDDIQAAIEQEAEKHGRVVSLTIPREPPKPPVRLDKPPEPPLLLPPHTDSPSPLYITSGPGAPPQAPPLPPGYALDQNNGALIPIENVADEVQKIEAENSRRKDEWKKVCDTMEKAYEDAREKWERELEDPIKNGVGKVFIEYWTSDEAHAAQVAMAGRQFDGRTVVTAFLPEDWFREPEKEFESFDDIMKSLEAGNDTLQLTEGEEKEEEADKQETSV